MPRLMPRPSIIALRSILSAALVLASTTVTTSSRAGSREECVDAHGRAQDLRDRNQLARARQTFLTCAQSSCPALVQQDCARYSEELAQLVPSVTFGARDASAADLPATSVYVDDVLLATRLDDGRSYELDPGKHLVRYVHDGRETTLKVVLNQGERGRLLVATFIDRAAGPPRRDTAVEPGSPPILESRRSVLPLVVAGLGAAGTITGGILIGVGASSVPDVCTTSTRECAAPANDPALAKAESGVRMQNAGIAIGVTGLLTAVGGLVWYLVQPTSVSDDSRRGRSFSPYLTF